nr:hypothetical protein [Tanacetum cinerariifolium]
MQAYNAISPPQVIIALPAVLLPSPVLSQSPIFDSQNFFSPEEISSPKDVETPVESSILVSPSSLVGSSSPVHIKMEMEMGIPCYSRVKFITACSYSTNTYVEIMKLQVKVSTLPQTLISTSSSACQDYDHGSFRAFPLYEAKHWLEIHFHVEQKLGFLRGVGRKELGK